MGHWLCWAWLQWCLAHEIAVDSPDWQGDGKSGFSSAAGRRQYCFFPVCSLRGKKWVDQIFRFPATQSHMSKLQYILLILSYRDELLLICLVSVWLSVLYLHQSMQIEHGATKLPFCKQMLACKLLLTQSLLWLLYVTEWSACMTLALPVYSCIMHHMHTTHFCSKTCMS